MRDGCIRTITVQPALISPLGLDKRQKPIGNIMLLQN